MQASLQNYINTPQERKNENVYILLFTLLCLARFACNHSKSFFLYFWNNSSTIGYVMRRHQAGMVNNQPAGYTAELY